jgi:hypothetical protein
MASVRKQFKLGDRVIWTSQSGSSWKTKAGVIVEVVAAGARPNRDRFLYLYKGPGVGQARDHESYVIETEKSRVNGRRMAKFYWPRVSALNLQEGNANG